jgi:hypothetical protein
VTNGDGTWTVWWRADPRRRVAAGAIGRFVPHGTRTPLVDDLGARGPLNLPRVGGLGGFGWHAAARSGCCDRRYVSRARSAEVDVGRAWDGDGRHVGAFGVAWARHTAPESRGGRTRVVVTVGLRGLDRATLFVTRYAWTFARRGATLRFRIEERGGGRTFVKEPKLALSLRDVYPHVTVLRHGRAVGQCNVDRLPPASALRSSCQLRERPTAAVRFDHGLAACPCLTARIDARGLDEWARHSDARACFARVGHTRADRPRTCASGDAGGCLDGGRLPRQWELHRLRGWEQLLVAAWTGGSGAYDCPVAARRLGPRGERFGVTIRFTIAAVSSPPRPRPARRASNPPRAGFRRARPRAARAAAARA